jgi:putative DNA primase/helicase
MTIEQDFAAAMAELALLPPEPVVADGAVHSFHVEGDKRGSKNGRYQIYADGHPAGWFGSHKVGIWHKWSAARTGALTSAEHTALADRMAGLRAARIAEQEAAQGTVATRAAMLWQRSKPVTVEHPYLARKAVKPYGIRVLREQLVIPVRDTDGRLWSLQFIAADGSKKFLTGGRKRGCYCSIGQPNGILCVCEGYATGASIYQATGYATAIAFDAGNLDSVAQNLRKKFPEHTLVLCADNDANTPGNPGVTSATAAARAVSGSVAIPTFAQVWP